jgi:hypothetical protein
MNTEKALDMAKDAYSASTTYMDQYLSPEWQKNERQWQSKHPLGSKYSTDDYRFRSKLFRPKTRSTGIANEADCAFAFFSNPQAMDVTAWNDSDPLQQASAVVWQEVAQYRLRESVPWFKIVQGGFQDALKNDVVFAHTYWKYKGKDYTEPQTVMNYRPSSTQIGMMEEYEEEIEVTRHKTLCDQPCIDLVPPEDLRIDPSCDWTDPINSSPYLIHIEKMTVEQVRTRMNSTDTKTGEPKWKKYSTEEIAGCVDNSSESEDGLSKERDPLEYAEDESKSPQIYDLVDVHKYFLRDEDGVDWFFYTLGCDKPLTKPVKSSDVYWHLRYRERPYVMGNILVETHKVYPEASLPKLTRDTQAEVNDFVNLRLDNVKLAILGRHYIKRTANMDYEMLRRNIPGSGVLTDNPDTDSKMIETQDVTSSSFQEQARMDNDFNDIAGGFSPSTLMQSRASAEMGARGMQTASAAATKIGDYRILSYAQTFMVPVLGQFIRLLQAYETDETIFTQAAEKGALVQQFGRYGINAITDDLLQQEMVVNVNVGLGATDPTGKVQRLVMALRGAVEIGGPMVQQLIKLEEVIPELFQAAGYQDGKRFFHTGEDGQDPRILQLQQMVQQLQQQIETKAVEEDARNKRMQELQDKKSLTDIATTKMKSDTAITKTMMDNSAKFETQALANQGAITNTVVGRESGPGQT